MNRFLHLSVCTLLALWLGVCPSWAQDYSGLPGRKLVCTYTLGDAMGEASGITKQEHFFAGADNRPLRGCLQGKGTGADFTLTKYYSFSQAAEDGNTVVSNFMSQWGKYDFGDDGLKAPAQQEAVTMAQDGKVLRKVTQSYAYDYEYDAQGSLVKETWTLASSGALSKTIEYVNGQDGLPTSAIEYNSKGTFSCKYVYDYDGNGNLTMKETYKRTAATDENTEYLNAIEEYKYDETGRQTEYIKYGSGKSNADPKLTSRKTYEPYNGNADKILETSYSSPTVDAEGNVTSWKKAATAYIYEYAGFTEGGRAQWAIDDLKAETAADKNDVNLTFSAPQGAGAGTRFAILRSGIPVAVVNYSDVKGEDGKCHYTETGVRLGKWEYFVVPFEGESLLDMTANTQRYMSNIATINVQTQTLRAVQNLRFEVKKEEYVQEGVTYTPYVITLKWDAQPGLAESSFTGHTPYYVKVLTNGTTSNGMLTNGNITDPATTSVSFDYMNTYDELNIFMVSHFTEGNAISDTITIRKADLERLSTPPFMAYGLYTNWDGALTASFDLNQLNAEAKTPITLGTQKMVAISNGVRCATVAGQKYVMFYDDINFNTAFATVNFNTGHVVDVNNYAFKYGKPGSMMQSLTYDAQSATLYGLEKAYSEATDGYETVIYTVEVKTGALTEVARYAEEYAAVVSDGKGALYVIKTTMNDKFQPVPSLWKLAADYSVEETAAVENTELGVMYSDANSCVASADGTKIYYITGTQVSVFDLKAKTFTTVGETDKLVYGLANALGTEDGEPTEAPKGEDSRKVVSKTWFGDSMGSIANTQDMTRELYFYNYDGKLARVAKYGRGYQGNGVAGDYELTHYTKNQFDDNANMLQSTKFQRGLYDFGDFAMKQVSETTYEYDAQGRLVKENTPSEIYGYEYDEAGNIVKKTVTNVYSGQLVQTIEYVDFVAPNKPTAAISEGAYDSYNYVANINYDDNLNKVLEVHNKMVEDPDFGMMMPMPFEVEEWTYEADALAAYTRYYYDAEGQAVPTMRTTYTPVEGNPDKVQSVDETYFDGQWYQQAGSTCVIEYADFAEDMLDMTRMEMMAMADEETAGQVNVIFSLPQVAYSGLTQMAIYRDGEKVAQEDAVNLYDFETGLCSYTDKGVRNGTHEYFVQPLVGTADEMGENVQWNGYFITYPIEVATETALPAVTDLHLAKARTVTTTQGFTQVKTQYATVGWTNPADRPEDFLSNDLLFEGMQMAEASVTDAEATEIEAEVSLDNLTPQVTVFVLSRYTLGNVKSEPLTITLADFNNVATGVEDASGQPAFRFARNVFSVEGCADLSVFTAAGQLVANARNAQSVSLQNLPAGTYVVFVKKGAEVKAVKVSR